ncbi:MAG: hypothetical protein GY929_13695 [Actinomycetia bacterium]|nr:hypothetical protein [Actinomycetes bacterium]
MSTATLYRLPAVPGRFALVGPTVAASVAAGVLALTLILMAVGPGSTAVLPLAPTTPLGEPAVATVSLSPMVVAGLPTDSVVGGASPISSVVPPVDHATAVGETPDSWPARPIPATPPPAAPVDRHAAPPAADEVGLIPAAIAWRDADGEVHQGLIGVDEIPAEVLALPEGVTLDE